jgi:FecR protein
MLSQFASTIGLLFLAASCAAANADTIGQAETAKNVVTGLMGAMTQAIASGDSVSGNETVKTGAASAALLRFLDKSNLTIGASSTVLLDRFVFNPDASARNGVIKLAKGAMRFVSGGPEPKDFAVETPVATLGVRGTDFIVICDGVRCIVLMSTGKVQVCPGHDCAVAYGLDQDRNFTWVGPHGENSGPGRINPSIIAAVIAAIASGEPHPSIVSLVAAASVNIHPNFGRNSIDSTRIFASPE